MSSVNKVILIGSVGNPPESRATKSGGVVTRFSLATNEKTLNKETGQYEPITQWHNISAFGKLAEIIQEWVKKGSKIYIEGKIRTSEYVDDSGKKRVSTQIIASDVQFLGSPKSDNQSQQKEASQKELDDLPF